VSAHGAETAFVGLQLAAGVGRAGPRMTAQRESNGPRSAAEGGG
jgi:hypothetical protein